MTLTQLEYLVAVDNYKSFAKAAQHCYVTQPTLSMQIKKLESSLNVLLFDRKQKPIATTDVGMQIVEQARIILQEADRVKEIILNEKDMLKGELHVGIIPTLSPYLLPLFITKFIKKYEDVNLVIEEITTAEIIQKLKNNQLDVGILVTPVNESKLIERPLFYEKFLVYVSTHHPLFTKNQVHLDELDTTDLWMLQEGHCFRSQTLNICGSNRENDNNRLTFESGSLETLKKIVEKEFGYTFLPELATQDFNHKQMKFIKHFQSPEPVREVSLITHERFVKKRLVALLEREIKANVPAELLNPNRGKVVLL